MAHRKPIHVQWHILQFPFCPDSSRFVVWKDSRKFLGLLRMNDLVPSLLTIKGRTPLFGAPSTGRIVLVWLIDATQIFNTSNVFPVALPDILVRDVALYTDMSRYWWGSATVLGWTHHLRGPHQRNRYTRGACLLDQYTGLAAENGF